MGIICRGSLALGNGCKKCRKCINERIAMSNNPQNVVESVNNYFSGPMWNWFELSYSAYLVVPRSLMCGMSREWQEQMVALLDECRERCSTLNIEDNYTVKLRGEDGKFKKDPLANYRNGNPFK